MATTFAALLDRHAAASFEKQLALADTIGDRAWNVDVPGGTIAFGDDQTFPMQILGTEGERAGTWLWAWANAASGLPPGVVAASEQVRAFGEREGVPELTAPELPLDAADGHRLSMVAAGITDADCYYRCPYQGGAMFVLLRAPAVRRAADASAVRFLTAFTQTISAFPLDHRAALAHYAAWKGWPTAPAADGMDVHAPDGTVIHATLDASGRLTNLQTTLHPR